MATALVIEEERGTCTGHVHAHEGYFAGDFTRRPTERHARATVAVRRIEVPAELGTTTRSTSEDSAPRIAA